MPTGVYIHKPHLKKTKEKISKANKGRHHTEETKRKISKANKGNIGWWKGKHHSKETREKISKAKKGRVGYWIGKHRSNETKRKISESLKGCIPWNKGIPASEESKRKMSESNKGHIAWNKGLHYKGHPMSEETKKKISEANKGKSIRHEGSFKKGQHSSPETEFKKGNKHSLKIIKKILTRRIPTSLENKFQKIVDKHNLPYKYVGDGKFFIERYNPDFINTNNEKIAVEVYARYYKKRNHENIEKWKEDRQKVFNRYGWKIIFFNEIEVNEKNILEKI